MTTKELMAELGHNQLVKDVQQYWRDLFRAKQHAVIRQKLEIEHHKAVDAALELQLEDTSAILGLPPAHPLVIASVIYVAKLRRDRRDRSDDDMPPSFIGGDW